ncbi:MAG: TlpA family protein disulfide reductase [Oceanipulchritudo sp.]
MNKTLRFLSRHAVTLLIILGIGAYVIVAGVTKSCPACAGITLAMGLTGKEPASLSQEEGKVQWTVQTLDGKQLSAESLAGKVVLVDFWATWCPPCRKEIPGFVELQEAYGDSGLVIVGVSLDRDGPPVVNSFAREYGIQYPLAMADQSILEAFGGIEALPTTFLIDRNGRIVSRHVGYVDKQVFETAIQSLL